MPGNITAIQISYEDATSAALTPNQIDALEELASFNRTYPEDWARPLDCGGFNGSHHGATLYRLSERGICERKSYYSWGGRRRTHKYRATDTTRAALANAQKKPGRD